jgi:hypothetical protein
LNKVAKKISTTWRKAKSILKNAGFSSNGVFQQLGKPPSFDDQHRWLLRLGCFIPCPNDSPTSEALEPLQLPTTMTFATPARGAAYDGNESA